MEERMRPPRDILDIWSRLPDYWDVYGTDGPDLLENGVGRIGNRYHGGGGEDKVFAGGGNDQVWGGSENDRLFGEGGTDELYGEQGYDLLDGGQGADQMWGGEGNDHYVVDNIDDKVIEAVNGGFDGVESHLFRYTLPPNVEHLYLKGSAVEGNGNELDNFIFGNDMDNFISGGDGEDNLFGGKGQDTISGGNHNDRIHGGAGADDLFGGNGANTFQWSSVTSITNHRVPAAQREKTSLPGRWRW
jgi:Ca2+-binding RTX toxin-like protein